MMKKRRSFLGLLAAMVMVCSMFLNAAAAESVSPADPSGYSIKIHNEKSGHIYEAYQIFKGDLSQKTENDESVYVLSNIEWGSNISETGKTELLKFKNGNYKDAISLADGLNDSNAADFADEAVKYLAGNPVGTANTVITDTAGQESYYLITGLTPGYYLIKDKDETWSDKNGSYTSYVLRVVADTEITPKGTQELPTVDKEVMDEIGDAESGSTNGWGETADHDINESFNFKLTAKIPADEGLAYYETYKVIFNDTMSAGITFESIASVKISNNGSTTEVAESKTDTDNGYVCTSEAGMNGGSWTLTIKNVKAYINEKDWAEKDTVIEVIYNAHLNENAAVGNSTDNNNTVYLQYSNNPNVGHEGELGKTTTDIVWVFTYEMDNTKVGENETPLAGAGFRIYRDEACSSEIGLIFDNDLKAYRPVKKNGSNAAQETAEEMFSAVIDEKSGQTVFNIKGLDAGTYYLKETTTPAGYNTLKDPIKIVISAEHREENSTSASVNITMTMNDEVSTNNIIVNKPGRVLPSTGGMGTRIFYIVGSVLVIAAIVLLVSRKYEKEK